MASSDELKYWVGFSKVPGIGRVKTSQLLEHFTTMEHAWKASAGELKRAGLDSKTVDNIVNFRPRIAPDEEMDSLKRYKVKVLTCDSTAYPQRLKEIYDYPPVLYVRGTLLPEDECCLAVVGTRRATVYGRQVAEELVTDLAR